MSDKHDHFMHQLQDTLQNSDEGIDELTSARLAAARKRALDAMPLAKPFPWAIPVSAVAAIMLVFTSLLLVHDTGNKPADSDIAVLEELDILENNVSFELMEDLEFYEWLDSQAETSA